MRIVLMIPLISLPPLGSAWLDKTFGSGSSHAMDDFANAASEQNGRALDAIVATGEAIEYYGGALDFVAGTGSAPRAFGKGLSAAARSLRGASRLAQKRC